MSAQIAGNTAANIAEVEANTLALRTTLRPEDYVSSSGGIYRIGGVSGVQNFGLAAGSPVFSFRNSSATFLLLVKRVLINAGNTATAFTAGVCTFNMVVARSFSGSDTGGTSLIPTGNMNKLRTTGMATTALVDARIGSTGATVAGSRTLDTIPIGTVVVGIPAVAGSTIIPASTPIFDQRPGEHPLVLAQNEGFILNVTMPATGTWTFGVTVDWSELTSY